MLAATAAAGLLYLLARAPLPPLAPPAQTSFVYASSGQLLATFEADGENRVVVPLSRIPKVLVDAVVATEDRNFFHEGAISPRGILRAAWADLRGRPLEGGSTITQQYVKNTYAGDQRTILRKLREAAIAYKLSRTLSKDQILDRYLNTIYFGRGAYGVQAAAEAYFGVPVSRVDLDEAAYLAGLIRAPTTADAYFDPAAAKVRRDLSLYAMVRSHYITRAAAARAAAVPVGGPRGYVEAPRADQAHTETGYGIPYFVSYVRELLVQQYGAAVVDGGGLRVTTSLDLSMQAKAYDTVCGFLHPGDPSAALVAVDGSGDVRAMVGGCDFSRSQVNLATGVMGGGTGRQAGSTFKAFLLAALVKDGWSVESSMSAPPEVVVAERGRPGYKVTNFESESFAHPIDVVQATRDSVNTFYAKLEAKLGVKALVSMAHAAGITSPLQAEPSLVLGTDDVSVLEMAGAYSTFADGGVQVPTRAVLEVKTADGSILQPNTVTRRRVLTPQQDAIVDYCLEQVVAHGTGTAAAIGRPLAGKTGTTEHEDDAWFVGYTPELTTAVWMGYADSESHAMTDVRGTAVTGGSFPAEIFSNFMRAATAGTPAEQFPAPPPLYGPSITGTLLAYSPPPSQAAASPGTGGAQASTTTSAPASGQPADGGPQPSPSGPRSGSPPPSSSTTVPPTTSTTEPTTTTTTTRTTPTSRPLVG